MPSKGEQTMHESEVRIVVAEVLAEQKRLHEDHIDDTVLRTITTLMTSFGLEEEDRKELQADFRHLRRWRKSVEQAQSLTFKTIVGVIVTGALGALWLGMKTLLGK